MVSLDLAQPTMAAGHRVYICEDKITRATWGGMSGMYEMRWPRDAGWLAALHSDDRSAFVSNSVYL